MKCVPPGQSGSIVSVEPRYENFIDGKWLPPGAASGGYKISGIGRENHKMMLDHYSQTKNLLADCTSKPLGFF